MLFIVCFHGGPQCWGGNSYGGVGVGDSYNRGDEASDMGDNLAEVGGRRSMRII